MKKEKVPDQTLIRLSYYLRAANYFINENKKVVSSRELAEFLRINPHQLRKDLSYFGQFGRKGVGYSLEFLKSKIQHILGLDKKWYACVVGFGNLARALSFYRGFRDQGIVIKVAFDKDPKKVNKEYRGIKVYHIREMGEVIKRGHIEIGIIAVPREEAQMVVDRLVGFGIKAILNFAPLKLNVPSYIVLKDVDLSCQFACLTYYLKR